MRLDCEEREREREHLPMFLRAAMSSSTAQQVKLPCTTFDSLLDYKSSSSSNSSMEKREVAQEELAATRLFAPVILLYPSTNFAVHRTSSQSTRNRNRGGNQRSRQL